MDVPSKRAINQRRVARFHERITAATERKDLDKFQSVVEQFRGQFPDITTENLCAALAAMAVGDTPLFVVDDVPQTGFRESRSARDEGRFENNDRRRGDDRPPRFERRDDRGSRDHAAAGPMETYRVEVGRNHGVKPGHLVGAIANEAGITSSHIGRIQLFDDHSLVDMADGMSTETLHVLKRVVVVGKPLEIARAEAGVAPQWTTDNKKPFEAKKTFETKKPYEKKPYEKKPYVKTTFAKQFDGAKKSSDRPAAKYGPTSTVKAKLKAKKKSKFKVGAKPGRTPS